MYVRWVEHKELHNRQKINTFAIFCMFNIYFEVVVDKSHKHDETVRRRLTRLAKQNWTKTVERGHAAGNCR